MGIAVAFVPPKRTSHDSDTFQGGASTSSSTRRSRPLSSSLPSAAGLIARVRSRSPAAARLVPFPSPSASLEPPAPLMEPSTSTGGSVNLGRQGSLLGRLTRKVSKSGNNAARAMRRSVGHASTGTAATGSSSSSGGPNGWTLVDAPLSTAVTTQKKEERRRLERSNSDNVTATRRRMAQQQSHGLAQALQQRDRSRTFGNADSGGGSPVPQGHTGAGGGGGFRFPPESDDEEHLGGGGAKMRPYRRTRADAGSRRTSFSKETFSRGSYFARQTLEDPFWGQEPPPMPSGPHVVYTSTMSSFPPRPPLVSRNSAAAGPNKGEPTTTLSPASLIAAEYLAKHGEHRPWLHLAASVSSTISPTAVEVPAKEESSRRPSTDVSSLSSHDSALGGKGHKRGQSADSSSTSLESHAAPSGGGVALAVAGRSTSLGGMTALATTAAAAAAVPSTVKTAAPGTAGEEESGSESTLSTSCRPWRQASSSGGGGFSSEDDGEFDEDEDFVDCFSTL